MDIIGSRAQGDRITAKVGGNLNIETLQEKETYEEQNSSTGFGFSWGVKAKEKASSAESTDQANTASTESTNGTPSGSDNTASSTGRKFFAPTIAGNWNKGNIDSHYRSARDQAGFFAGSGGFDIYVEKNTDFKGGVIASEASADKNKLSTGTFSFSDLHNEAEYTAKDTGSSAQIKPTLVQIKEKNPDGSENKTLKVVQALHPTPSIPTVVQGSANSTTKSAVAPGTIDIRENPTQDISSLSRDTANALNELGRIFDKKSVEEQKELVNVFREEAFRLAHNLPDDGSGRKTIIHAAIGGILSQLSGAGFASGAAGAGLNEALINNLKGLDLTIAQIASGVLGAAAAKIVNGDATAGAIAAASGTKHNFFGGTAAGSITPQMMASLTGYVVIIYEGTQYIQKAATNEIIAKLQQDGSWLFNEIDSALESVFKEHNIPYSQPQTLNGPHYYITPPITVTSPDHEHFPFALSPNILDIKYKPRTNPLLDFKEQWSRQDFSDGNRFFSKGVEKEKADKAYPPADEHSSTNNPIKRTGKPNSSIDRVDEKGRIITRRWYDGNGRAKKDVDFTDHGNPKTHPEVPHEHTWEWDKNGHSNRK